MRYRDRDHAGDVLAEAVADRIRAGEPVVVLGIPRGGVPVARRVADRLGAELDVAVARKVGAPMQPELALGAVTPEGPPVWNQGLIARIGVGEAELQAELVRERAEAARRYAAYRTGRPPVDVAGKTAVVVDDGVATGATIVAVAREVGAKGAGRIVIAVPVGPPDTVRMLEAEADEVVCPATPRLFRAVGEFYDDFGQLRDEDVLEALRRGDGR